MSALAIGPVAISEALRGLLALRRALCERLPERAQELGPRGRTMTLASLEQIEAELGVVLPFDVIALVALGIPILARASGLDRDGLGVQDEPAAFAPWVPIAATEATAMDPDYEPSPTDQVIFAMTLCVSAQAHDRRGDPMVLVLDEAHPDEAEPQRLSAFLRRRLALRYDESSAWTDVLARAAGDDRPLEPGCIAEIVDDRPAPTAVRVFHAKFGAGTVVRGLEGEKVEVRFDVGGTRTLLEKFLIHET